jgi:hypothetical protein
MNLVDATARVLTANLAMSMQLSFLHPDNLLPGADWLSRPIAKQLSGMAHQIFMFLPKEFVAQALHTKPIEEVVEEGEDSIVDNAVDQLLVKNLKGFVSKIAVAGARELGEQITGSEPKPVPTQKTFNQAYNDRLAGGANQEEQDKQWGKYQKQKMKEGKKEFFKAMMMKDKLTDKAEKSQEKDSMKEMRKQEKDPTFKKVKETIERNLVTYRNKKGDPLLRQLAEDKLSSLTLLSFDDDQKGALEELLLMEPGGLDKQLAGSNGFQLTIINLAPYLKPGGAPIKTLPQLIEDNTLSTDLLKTLTPMEKTHLGLYFGLSLIGVKTLIGEGAPVFGRGRSPRQQPPVPVKN